MEDPESAESKEKSNFRFFRCLFFELWSLLFKSYQFSMNLHDNSKNRNRKIVFSFVSAHCASFIKVGSKLRGEGEGQG